VTAVNVGNPHCVVFVDDLAGADLGVLGPALEHHPLFPRRTNVQLARVEDRGRVRIRIWERGAGETLASGSSASAVAAPCVRLDRTARTVRVRVDGGDLSVEIGDDWSIRMRGPATIIYHGVLAPSFVAALALSSRG